MDNEISWSLIEKLMRRAVDLQIELWGVMREIEKEVGD